MNKWDREELYASNQWFEIPGFSLYQITKSGIVWSKQWERPLKQTERSSGTLEVHLISDDNYKRKTIRLSLLLEMVFGDDA